MKNICWGKVNYIDTFFFLRAPSPFKYFFLLLGRLKISFLLPACATEMPMLPSHQDSHLQSITSRVSDVRPAHHDKNSYCLLLKYNLDILLIQRLYDRGWLGQQWADFILYYPFS